MQKQGAESGAMASGPPERAAGSGGAFVISSAAAVDANGPLRTAAGRRWLLAFALAAAVGVVSFLSNITSTEQLSGQADVVLAARWSFSLIVNAGAVDAVRVAHTWKDASPVAERAAVTIEDRLRTDKGIDLTSLRDTVNTAVVAAAVERELADRAEREHQADGNADRSVLGADDSRTTPPAQHLPLSTVGWDTAQRREQHRAEFTIAGLDTEAIDAHLLTDTANAAALDSTSMRTPAVTPAATPGDRGQDLDRSMDRGGR